MQRNHKAFKQKLPEQNHWVIVQLLASAWMQSIRLVQLKYNLI